VAWRIGSELVEAVRLFGPGPTGYQIDPIGGDLPCYAPGDGRPRGIVVDNVNACVGPELRSVAEIAAFQDSAIRFTLDMPLPGLPRGLSGLGGSMFDALACSQDPFCQASIAAAIAKNPTALAQTQLAIASNPVALAQTQLAIASSPALTAQVGQALMRQQMFDLLNAANGFNFGIPNGTGMNPGPTQPESFFGALGGAIVPLLTQLAQAGVIRGSVGQALAPMPMAPNAMIASAVGMSPSGFLPFAPSLGGALTLPAAGTILGAGSLAIDAMQALSGLFGSAPSCGGARPAVQAPSLFRMNACGKSTLPSRTQVIGPDGAIYVVANLGRATRGSSEGRVMRRLARDNGFVVSRRGAARGRRRPR